MDRHSALKSQAMATSGMEIVGPLDGVWGIAQSDIAGSTKKLQVSKTRHAMEHCKASIRSDSGAVGAGATL